MFRKRANFVGSCSSKQDRWTFESRRNQFEDVLVTPWRPPHGRATVKHAYPFSCTERGGEGRKGSDPPRTLPPLLRYYYYNRESSSVRAGKFVVPFATAHPLDVGERWTILPASFLSRSLPFITFLFFSHMRRYMDDHRTTLARGHAAPIDVASSQLSLTRACCTSEKSGWIPSSRV